MYKHRKLLSAIIAFAMLMTLAIPTMANVATLADLAAKEQQRIAVASEGDEWVYLKAGESYIGANGDEFFADTDMWINEQTDIEGEEKIVLSDLFNAAPEKVTTMTDELGRTYTVRSYSDPGVVSQISSALSVYFTDEETLADIGAAPDMKLNSIDEDEMVDVIVVLKGEPLAQTGAITIGGLDNAAFAQIESIKAEHSIVAKSIINGIDDATVIYDYTMLLNGLSLNMRYGDMDKLNAIDGVEYAFVAPVFNPTTDSFTVLNGNEMAGDGATAGVQTVAQTIGADLAWLEGYTGAGMTVAIIDTGIDVDHAMLSTSPETPSMTVESLAAILDSMELNAETLVNGLTAETVYASAKIPFQFDYADGDADADDAMGHGSHVAGIVAGSTTDNLINTYGITNVGIAPDAQLLAMKVFDTNGGASMTNVVAALEDAILLGVDGANLSLGVACGSVTGYSDIAAVFNNALNVGINVYVAAGNDTNSTYTSLWNNDLGLASNPDIGVMGMPGTFDAPVTVASSDNPMYLAGFSSSLDRFTFSIGASNYAYAFSDRSPFAYRMGVVLGGADWAYVTLNNGAESDYEGIDVAGKIVLAKLSDDITIDQQSAIAAQHGAVGMILYPATAAGGQFANPDTTHTTYNIPVVGMAYFYGNNLATTIVPEKLHVNAYYIADDDNGGISPFSSWGATNELTLKPDVTGIGGNVVSAYRNNSIAISSGTSMASPGVTGVGMLIRQYLEANYDITGKDLAVITDALLMSGAQPLTDIDSGLPYSPRVQGAGRVDAFAAIMSGAYIDSASNDKAKFELGDDPERTGVYTFTFDVVNMDDTAKEYALSVLTMTESAVNGRVNPDHTYEYLMEQFAYALNPAVDAPMTVNVEANSSTTVTVTITLSQSDLAYINRYFENGIYIEGYVTLAGEGEEVEISAPFMGFYGDWTDAPVIENNFFYDWATDDYPANTTLFANSVYTYNEVTNETYFIGDTQSGKGQTPYGIQIGSNMMYWDERNAISPNGDGVRDYLDVCTGLLRNAKEYRYVIIDRETGEELYRKDMGYTPKTYYSSANDAMITAGMYVGQELDFDWTTLENNQTVIVRIEAVLDYEGNDEIESWEFPVTADYESPVSNIRLYKSGTRYYVSNSIVENRFVDYSNIIASYADGSTSYYRVSYGGYDPAGRTATITHGFSSLATEAVSMTVDYAGNVNYLYITMDEIESSVILDADTAIMRVGDSIDVHQLFEFDTNTDINCTLTWSSSDAAVASVTDGTTEGATIIANAVGEAIITATNGMQISDSMNIIVVAEDDAEYADIRFDAGDFGTITGREKIVLPIGYVITEDDVPTVIPDSEHIFKDWYDEPINYVVDGDFTFVARYRNFIAPVVQTYVLDSQIVPGEKYLIVAEHQGKLYAMSNTLHIGNAVALDGVEVTATQYDGLSAVIASNRTDCEWVFSTETAGTIQNVANGRYADVVQNSGYSWLGLSATSGVTWTFDGNGHMTHNDSAAETYTHLSYGVSASGYSAGFDIFEPTDPAYTTIQLYRYVEIPAAEYTVTFVDGLTNEVISTVSVTEGEDAEVPQAPEHEGYTFVRWDDDATYITDDLTVTAEYDVNMYSVIFVDGYSNEIVSTQTIAHGQSAEAPTPAEYTGMHFTGWDTDYSVITTHVTITSVYDVNTYTVRFLDYNGNEIATQQVEHGAAATEPGEPQRVGWTFVSWDADFSNITSDIDINAIYEINMYNVYFVDRDGTILSSQVVAYGEDAVAPADPQLEYYNFIGWNMAFNNVTENIVTVAQYELAIAVGDVNLDGNVDIIDALTALRIVLGMETANDVQLIVGNVNEDGTLNSCDILTILRYAIGLVDNLQQ